MNSNVSGSGAAEEEVQKKPFQFLPINRDFWLSVGSPISPDVRPSGSRAKILNQI